MAINTNGYWALVMRALMEGGDVASIYTQMDNPDNFYIGYITHMTQRQFALRMLDIDGSYDGWLIGRNADVVQVIAGDDYETRIRWLESLQSAEIPDDPLPNGDYQNLFYAYGSVMQQRHEPVTIWCSDSEEEIIGFIQRVDELHMEISALDFYGQDAGGLMIKLTDIELMSVDAMEERMYNRMHSNISPLTPLKLI